MDEKKVSILVLMDMSKAFDSINLNMFLEVFKFDSLVFISTGMVQKLSKWKVTICFYWGCGFAVSPS